MCLTVQKICFSSQSSERSAFFSEEFMEAYSSQVTQQVCPARPQHTSVTRQVCPARPQHTLHTALSIQAIRNNILTSNIGIVKN